MSNFPKYDTKLFTEIWDNAEDFVYDYNNVGIPTTITDANATTLFYLIYARYGNNPIANFDEEQFKYKMFSVIFQYGPTWEKRLSIQETLRGLQLSDLVDDGSLHELLSHSGSQNSLNTGSNGNTRTLNTAEANTGTSSTAHTGTVGVSGQAEDIKNHALNPGTAPAANAYTPLTYINDQLADKATNSSTTTYNNTDTTTNNLNRTDTGTITDAGTVSHSADAEDEAENETTRTLTTGKLKAYEKLLELLDTDVTGEFISKFKICFKQFVVPERTFIYISDEDEEE